MANRIVDAKITFISLVNKGANRQEFKIFKSADHEDLPDMVENRVDEVRKNIESEVKKSLFDKLVSLFKRELKMEQAIEKEAQISDFNARINDLPSNVWRALDTLGWVIWEINSSDVENKLELITQSVDQFKEFVIRACNTVGITKAFEGSPNSVLVKSQIESLKALVDSIQKADEKLSKGEEEVNAEDITKAVSEALKPINETVDEVKKALDEVRTKVEALEKETDEVKKETEEVKAEAVEKSTEKVEDIKKSLTEALEPISKSIEELKGSISSLSDRVTTIENTRGISKARDSEELNKSADEWAPLNRLFE